ncbi:MAG: cyclic nucleotide-binding domain-containing protein [Nevskia sp.]|nr:cyclic nucleotide-binding domain-containing protein [Nevskia sp.]
MSKLSDQDIAWLARHGSRVQIGAGQELVRAGSRIQTLYFVLDGELGVVTRDGTALASLKSGEVVGEMSFVDPAPTNVSVVSRRPSLLLAVQHEHLRDAFKTDVGFCARFYHALSIFMADRIRQMNARQAGGGDADELDDSLLDDVHLAGARFEWVLRQLAG